MKAGLQVWSLNGVLDDDIKKKLALAAESGFDGVEFAGFGGLSAEEMKAELEKNSLRAFGSHSGIEIFRDSLNEELEYLRTIGAKYMIIPWATYENGMQDVDDVATLLNSASETAKKYGIKVGYHNHSQEFKKIDDKYILDLLIEKTTDDVVFEVDVFWVTYAGVDPYEYVKAKGKRIELIHMKQIDEKKENVMLPDGLIDFARICESAKYAKEFVVEQEGSVDKITACRVNGEFVSKM